MASQRNALSSLIHSELFIGFHFQPTSLPSAIKFSTMASQRNALSSLIHSELFIGFHFQPTDEEGIRIVNIKNGDGQLLPIFNVDDDLLQYRPEQLKECYCFTRLEPLGKNKVNRTLRDGSGHWKNILTKAVKDGNKKSIGWLTKLVLHKDKNTPTEWHLLEYRDTEWPDAGRWVLCQIYKREKNNDSGSSGCFDPYNTTVPEPVASDIGAYQIYLSTSQDSSLWASGATQPDGASMVYNSQQFPSCPNPIDDFIPQLSQGSSMWASYAREDMNQVHYYEMGQRSNTQPDGASMVYNSQQFPSCPNPIDDFIPQLSQGSSMWATYAREDMNQVQYCEMGQRSNTQPDGASMVYNSRQFPSCPNPIDDFIPQLSQGSSMWASYAREDMNQVQYCEMGQCSNTQPDGASMVYNSQQFPSCPSPIDDFIPQLSQGSSMWASYARDEMNQVQYCEMGQCSNTQPDGASMVYNSQQFPSCPNPIDDFIPQLSQGSSMWASYAREDMNQDHYYEMGQRSNTQPDGASMAATNPDLTGGHRNQDQIPGVGGMVYNSQQFPSSSN